MKTGKDQQEKIALITGGGTGIGLATAKALAADGFHVILSGRRQDVLEQAVLQISPEKSTAISVDVTDLSSVTHLFGEIEKHFGRLDVLFNNAGVSLPSIPVEDISYEDWKRVVDINLNGVFLVLQAAVRLMKKQTPKGGRIINNGSISAHVPRLYSAAYTATKHAVAGLTKSAALDCRAHDIAVCEIDIGNASTSMTEKMNAGVIQADGSIRQEPTMHVDHVAQTIRHIAGLPLDANALFVTLMATDMPYVGRG